MKITALVENQSQSKAVPKHGLSLYIEMSGHKILFDVGPDETLFENSESLGIDLFGIDIVILSHGHSDHGGALEPFLKLNHSAKVYAQRKAFDYHYSKRLFWKFDASIPQSLQTHPQVVLVDGDYRISDDLMLFTTPSTEKYRSSANNTLYSGPKKDDFSHEHNLMIFGETDVLVIGCGHAGVVNIMERAAEYNPKVCVGGFHLWNPMTKKTVPGKILNGISQELSKYDVRFYTCHCTGQKAFDYLAGRLSNMRYLHCGETIEL